MKSLLYFAVILIYSVGISHKADGQVKLHTEDLPHFYEAFDSVMTTKDTLKQADFVQKLYVDKASVGLKEFMELRGGSTQTWRKFIEDNKSSLIEKRPWILSVLSQETEIRNRIALFKKYYPDFRDGDIYFCVGIGNSGGTIRDRTVYIGTEVAAGSTPNWAVYLVLHEFAHTQQWVQRNINSLNQNEKLGQEYERTHQNLLGKCLEEGMADFVAELVLGQQLSVVNPDGYIAFGLKHEQTIWIQYQKEMNQKFDYDKGWLYAEKTIDDKRMKDLGYFVGYQICKSFYNKVKDKKQALNYMLGLNLTDENSKNFLLLSRYKVQRKHGQ
ncbi:hypothetical protein [Spirosoma utsteinense]|uniref:DUF2268 domain-containing protein n=1 Tax=Spirosoma utsteinense TaxID=2585773 RepID=A0ABR6WFP9_9BACT|nr:hypothetical protein [Spirosoma utsteinense]MBC3788825.1 putative protein YjaZ [Spirosoma utsteinense]MBC3794846.1 putative protein YjaZ [Spirosoma utsteinense]